MKGIYIYSSNDKDYKANGEAKKVLSQVKAFQKAGVEIEFLDVILDRKIDKVLYRMPFCGVYPKDFVKKCELKVPDADFVFIRKNIFDGTYYNLLKTMKQANPKIKVIVEIPTYPYFQEWNRFVDKPLIRKEKRVIPKVAAEKLVDYYLTLTDDTEIFGIPTIKFDNCIEVDEYPQKKNSAKTNEIYLLGVALLANWHGFDRVIKGMNEYYKKPVNSTKVFFHIVGEGPEFTNLKELVNQYGLEQYVLFEGKQHGEKLDETFDNANIGVGSLGIHRKGLENARSLKNREYCARGIPFIKAGGDELFDNYEYCLSFPNNDEPVDISKIVSWSSAIDYEKAAVSMRDYAAHNLDWGRYIDEIIKKIK